MPKPNIQVRLEKDKVVCYLPITQHKGKVRVKRNFKPLATRQKELKPEDLIEWQISYKKNGKLVELGEILEYACKINLLTKNDLNDLKKYCESIENFFDESFDIITEKLDELFLNEFEILYEKAPMIRKKLSSECFIIIKYSHRQKAVGFQSMVYIYIPIKKVKSSINRNLLNRRAQPNEKVKWIPTKNDIEWLVKSFAIASRKHKDDIVKILENFI